MIHAWTHPPLDRSDRRLCIDDLAPGQDLSSKFKPRSEGVKERTLATPITALPAGKLKVSIKDRQGNISEVERTFSVSAP